MHLGPSHSYSEGTSMQEITAAEAASLLAGPNAGDAVLLDVREDAELAMASIEGALHIPMGEIVERADELDQNKAVVVMCHTGGRSSQVAAYLTQQGFAEVYNLTGGITAWTRDVDPSVPEY